MFAFNPITGALVEDIPSDGLHLDFNVVQSFMLGEMDEQFLRGVVMVDDSLKVICLSNQIFVALALAWVT